MSFDAGRATTFSLRHDKHNKGKAACLNPKRLKLRTKAAWKLYKAGYYVANSSATCWAIVDACSPAGLCGEAATVDRGPVHARLDMSPKLTRKIKHTGGVLIFRWQPTPRKEDVSRVASLETPRNPN